MSEEREQRNQVFAQGNTAPVVDPRIASYTATERAKADFGLDIPNETVPLPSGGKVYPQGHPLHGKETVDIRAMTAREEDVLVSRAFLKKGTIITELIRSCLIDKAIDPGALLSGDRNALMVSIRITGYGADYDAEIECSECGFKAPQTFNLAALPIRTLSIEPVEPGTNAFEFTLPYCRKNVRFKFMTGHDEEEIVATSERQRKLGVSSDSSVTTNLLYSIVSVDGVTDRGKLASFVRMMPARDSIALRTYIRDAEPGLQMKQEVTCTSCGHIEEVSMPIGVKFLWPAAG